MVKGAALIGRFENLWKRRVFEQRSNISSESESVQLTKQSELELNQDERNGRQRTTTTIGQVRSSEFKEFQAQRIVMIQASIV